MLRSSHMLAFKLTAIILSTSLTAIGTVMLLRNITACREEGDVSEAELIVKCKEPIERLEDERSVKDVGGTQHDTDQESDKEVIQAPS